MDMWAWVRAPVTLPTLTAAGCTLAHLYVRSHARTPGHMPAALHATLYKYPPVRPLAATYHCLLACTSAHLPLGVPTC